MRYLISAEGDLLLANVFRGTLERRALPGLEVAGVEGITPVGRWAHLEGLE